MMPFDQPHIPKTSLVICSRNRQKLLLETVESVLRGNEIPQEIVIVDQSDAPLYLLDHLRTPRDCEISYIHLQSTGASRARNMGAQLAKSEIIAFLDDDMLVAP